MRDATELHDRLNGETARIGWVELERHFARGALIRVARGEDLVAVAAGFVEDDRARVASWLESGTIAHTSSEDAMRWARGEQSLWAVVVAPWVLVQEST